MKKIITLVLLFNYCVISSCQTDDSYASWVESCIDQAPAIPFTMVSTGEVRMAREIDYDLLVGAPLPEFQCMNLKGEEVNLSSIKGKMTMINFWFMRCPPCLKEFEMFNKLVEKYDDRVDFLSFTFDQSTEVDSLMLIHPFLFDIVPDARDIIDDDFMCFWSYPFSIVANKENRIVYILDDFGRSNNNDEKIVTLDSLIQANI